MESFNELQKELNFVDSYKVSIEHFEDWVEHYEKIHMKYLIHRSICLLSSGNLLKYTKIS